MSMGLDNDKSAHILLFNSSIGFVLLKTILELSDI